MILCLLVRWISTKAYLKNNNNNKQTNTQKYRETINWNFFLKLLAVSRHIFRNSENVNNNSVSIL